MMTIKTVVFWKKIEYCHHWT